MTDEPDAPAPSAVEGGRRSRAARPATSDIHDDAVGVTDTTSSIWPGANRLLMGYPPVLGAMLLIDGVVALAGGGTARVSAGEVAAYLLLPPSAVLLAWLTTAGGRHRVVALGACVAAVAALLAALFLGGGVTLLSIPAWLEVVAGLALLGTAAVLLSPRRAHQGRRRADR